jgi:hypothetical protein
MARLRGHSPSDLRPREELFSSPHRRRSNRPNTAREVGGPHRRLSGNQWRDSREQTPLGVQALNEGGFGQNFAAYWLSSDPIDCNKRQPIDPAFGQLGSEPAEIVV